MGIRSKLTNNITKKVGELIIEHRGKLKRR